MRFQTTALTPFPSSRRQISANTQVKTIEGHYTGHFKSVVTKPQNVYIMRDIACAGYMAGCNARWFAADSDAAGALEISSTGDDTFGTQVNAAANVKRSIMSRLSFQDDVYSVYPSLLAFPMTKTQAKTMDTSMSISNRLLPWEVQGPGSAHDSFPGGEQAWIVYSSEFGLKSIHFGEDMKATENMEFVSQVCYKSSKPLLRARGLFTRYCTKHDRDRRTTRSASWALTASTIPSRIPSTS